MLHFFRLALVDEFINYFQNINPVPLLGKISQVAKTINYAIGKIDDLVDVLRFQNL